MPEEFRGEIPEIEICKEDDNNFTYWCKTAGLIYNPELYMSCLQKTTFEPTEKCYDCLGYNGEFSRYYNKNKVCSSCPRKVDFGYFILIFLLEKADLLPKKFKIECCICRKFK